MSLNRDRKQAVQDACTFLHRVADPSQTRKVPGPIRAEASLIARHFPTPEEIAGWDGRQMLASEDNIPPADNAEEAGRCLIWMSEAFVRALPPGLPNLTLFVEAYARFSEPGASPSPSQRVLWVGNQALCAELMAILELLQPRPVAVVETKAKNE